MGQGRHCRWQLGRSAKGRQRPAGRFNIARGLTTLPPLGPAHHHIDIAAAAPEAHMPLVPTGNDCFRALCNSLVNSPSTSIGWRFMITEGSLVGHLRPCALCHCTSPDDLLC
jgi:hypothetical protein